MIAPIPPNATPAPIRPPIIALLLESGIPIRVAMKIRRIADAMPTMIDVGVSAFFVTIVVPIVAATAVVKMNGPSMLQIAVRKTAFAGESARVATTVAMECEASLSPLTNARPSARTIPKRMSGSMMGTGSRGSLRDNPRP